MVTEEILSSGWPASVLSRLSQSLGIVNGNEDPASHAWLVPGPAGWELWDSDPSGEDRLVRAVEESEEEVAEKISLVALSAALITCQTFWLETEDERAVPDLVRMQCERRGLIRADEIWSYRPLVKRDGRTLVQTLILQNTIPARIEVDGTPRFEAHARCLELPAGAVCIWKEAGGIAMALTEDGEPTYFQALPHKDLSRECVRDIQSVCLLGWAQDWCRNSSECVLAGEWTGEGAERLKGALTIPVRQIERFPLRVPPAAMELIPRAVRARQAAHRRMVRIRLLAIALAAIYLLFVAEQAVTVVVRSMSNGRLEKKLNARMPDVLKMQTTARQLEVLNPALDTKTYPLEILYRATVLLPEKGVRLTRFEIVGDRLEVAGESTTAREAFDYMRALKASNNLQHIQWEDPPQPVPLPNDTTRFVIHGSIAGAWREEENAQN